MSTLIPIRDAGVAAAAVDGVDGFYSPAKQKAANRGAYGNRPLLSLRRAKQFLGAAKFKLFLAFCAFSVVVFVNSRLSSWMGWNPHHPSSVSSTSRGGYTVLINTWKQNSILKQAVAHYASCRSADAIHVVWNESEPPSEMLKTYLDKIVDLKSQRAHKPNIRFGINAEDKSNSRFKPMKDIWTDAIFSVDDDVIVPCHTLDFAFSVWQSAPFTMVGFVPRMHWLDKELNNVAYYRYGGWWSVWWMGTYSMVLSKAAFFHRKYLDLYTNQMAPSIQDYASRERNCEDIAMSLLVANATGGPPIWVKGKIYEIGASGISSLRGHSHRRNKCLNDLISLYGSLPLVSTNVKAVSASNEWLW
ncbi:glycosylinositol phosphorylceramide mannosyl transferase 1-like [Gastrolobium bilobum]|uniref:glycosylinositol phosphorylceramide mannosyl transferase 1-like n=1 Tax=Gastrolobium bilobum TaxID=150636 RepID=UPI002AAF2CA2|nr:glycosylinositol phosphorylceramide mannosyl transferase 1-like [Gastrolobium bilobum]